MAVQIMTTYQDGILWNTFQASSMLPYFPYYVNQAKMSLIMFEIQVPFFCLQQEIQIKLISHVHINGTNIIFLRTKKAALTFSISKLHLPTVSSLIVLSHQCKEPEKNFEAG